MKWPSELEDTARELGTLLGCSGPLDLREEFGSGLSGARVFLVDCPGGRHDGHAVLKLSAWSDEAVNEALTHQAAFDQSPDFAAASIPRILDHSHVGTWSCVLYELAGSSRLYVTPLWSVARQSSELAPRLQTVGLGMLTQWNSQAHPSVEMSPAALIAAQLGRKMNSGLSRVRSLYSRRLGLDEPGTAEAFSFAGRALPSPLGWLDDVDRWSSALTTRPLVGNEHGDLHGHNVLVHRMQRDSFQLIDFSHYRPDVPLGFDHAYMELSLLLQEYENASPQRWLVLMDALFTGDWSSVDTTAAEIEDEGILRALHSLRSAPALWATSKHKGRIDDVAIQFLTARIAAGLNFADKREISDECRLLSVLYAAHALRQTLALLGQPWKTSGPPVSLGEFAVTEAGDAWRSIWQHAKIEEDGSRALVLVIGPGVCPGARTSALASLGLVDWSLIVDLAVDSHESSLHSAVIPLIAERRKTLRIVPTDSERIPFARSTTWLMARGAPERPETVLMDTQAWRRKSLPVLRQLMEGLSHETRPKPVSVVVLSEGIDLQQRDAILFAADEVFGDAATFVVTHPDGGSMASPPPFGVVAECSASAFAAGITYMRGNHRSGVIRVPAREGALELAPADVAKMQESLQIVHSGLVEATPLDCQDDGSFLRGNAVSWQELGAREDVDRDATEALKKRILESAEQRVSVVRLAHYPGAGGTTVARRALWDLRNAYPCAMLVEGDPEVGRVAEQVAMLFHATEQPVVVLVERALLSEEALERLRATLQSWNCRVVLVSVARDLDAGAAAQLPQAMGADESERFLRRYSEIAPSRTETLAALTHDPSFEKYRSPFFYGLCAFDEGFVHTEGYVAQHLSGASHATRDLLVSLAIVSRFSQASIWPSELLALLGLPQSSTLDVAGIFGQPAGRLLYHSDEGIRIVHPLIAEEVLRQCLGFDSWQLSLADSSVRLIKLVADTIGDTEHSQRMLMQLFITRHSIESTIDADLEDEIVLQSPQAAADAASRPSPRSLGLGGGEARTRISRFSELLTLIPDTYGRRRVLETLVQLFPSEPHYYNHLARYHIYENEEGHATAVDLLAQAIKLDPKNDIHHHTLGMAYRTAAKRTLRGFINATEPPTLDDAFRSVEPVLAKGEESFSESRRLDPEQPHGWVTHAQMLVEAMEGLARIARRARSDSSLVTGDSAAAVWTRARASLVRGLLDDVRLRHRSQKQQDYVIEWTSRLDNVCGFSDEVIRRLERMVDAEGVDRHAIRRLLASAYRSKHHHDWTEVPEDECRRIRTLVAANIARGPIFGGDVMTWFNASRRLPEFDVADAIERFTQWSMTESALDADYYLYVMHLLRIHLGLTQKTDEYRRYQDKTAALSSAFGKRTLSWEWLTLAPEPCPLAPAREIGEWPRGSHFFKNTERLARVEGAMSDWRSPQAGSVSYRGVSAFFVPGQEFHSSDINVPVTFFLGFSYAGPRAWGVMRS